MTNMGKTIRIYLADGSVSGIRHAEIVNWTGQAVSSPRTKIKSLNGWDESKKPGVYFLFGIDEESGKDAVYIGEAENVFDRLQNHIANKDFWNEVIFFTNKDENLTKSHVKYLESRLIKLVKSFARYVVLNGNESQLPSLPRGDRDAMEEFLGNLKILLGALGYKALEPLMNDMPSDFSYDQNISVNQPAEDDQIELNLNVKNIKARSYLTNEGIVVAHGSQVSKAVRRSLSPGYQKLREQLIKNGVIAKAAGGYEFTENQLFKSPSQAAAVIVGYPMNGRIYWKTKDGVTLKQLEEEVKK